MNILKSHRDLREPYIKNREENLNIHLVRPKMTFDFFKDIVITRTNLFISPNTYIKSPYEGLLLLHKS